MPPYYVLAFMIFQSTPPCGGDFAFNHADGRPDVFQSTPPCGGDLGDDHLVFAGSSISIHAPLRGRPNHSVAIFNAF